MSKQLINKQIHSFIHYMMPPPQTFYITESQRIILSQTSVQIINTMLHEGKQQILRYDEITDIIFYENRIMLNKQVFQLRTKAASILYNNLIYRRAMFLYWVTRLSIPQFVQILIALENCNQQNENYKIFGRVNTEQLQYIRDIIKLQGTTVNPWRLQKGEFSEITFNLTEDFDIVKQDVTNEDQQNIVNSQIQLYKSEKAMEQQQSRQSQDNALFYQLKKLQLLRAYIKSKYLVPEQVMIKSIIDTNIITNYQQRLQQSARVFNKQLKTDTQLEELGNIVKDLCTEIQNEIMQNDQSKIKSINFNKFLLNKNFQLANMDILDPLDIDTLLIYSIETLFFQFINTKQLFQLIYDKYEIEDLKIYNYCQLIRNTDIYQLLDINQKYYDPDNFEYACVILSSLNTVGNCVCTQYLHVFLETVTSITQTVEANSRGSCSLACDDLLPLVIFVCLKTSCDHFLSILRYCEAFINEKLENNEYGNVVIHFHVALEYIQQLHQKQLHEEK